MFDTLNQWLSDPLMGRLVTIAFGLILIYAIIRVLRRLLTRYIEDNSTRYRTRKFVSFLGYLAAALMIAVVFSDRLGGLTITLGVAGAGIAFALQEVIASVAGWLAIALSNFYSVGDRVKLGGVMGDVIDIGVLRTTLMECGEWVEGDLYNGRIVRVANSFVFKEPVVNYSADFPFLWDEIRVPVRYGSDRDLARTILETVIQETVGAYAEEAKKTWRHMVEKFRIEDASVAPIVTMVMDENWMTFTVRYVVDYQKRRTTKDVLFTRILQEFDQTKGQVQVASAAQEIFLKESPRLQVQLKTA